MFRTRVRYSSRSVKRVEFRLPTARKSPTVIDACASQSFSVARGREVESVFTPPERGRSRKQSTGTLLHFIGNETFHKKATLMPEAGRPKESRAAPPPNPTRTPSPPELSRPTRLRVCERQAGLGGEPWGVSRAHERKKDDASRTHERRPAFVRLRVMQIPSASRR